jgi:hypothetical protein
MCVLWLCCSERRARPPTRRAPRHAPGPPEAVIRRAARLPRRHGQRSSAASSSPLKRQIRGPHICRFRQRRNLATHPTTPPPTTVGAGGPKISVRRHASRSPRARRSEASSATAGHWKTPLGAESASRGARSGARDPRWSLHDHPPEDRGSPVQFQPPAAHRHRLRRPASGRQRPPRPAPRARASHPVREVGPPAPLLPHRHRHLGRPVDSQPRSPGSTVATASPARSGRASSGPLSPHSFQPQR